MLSLGTYPEVSLSDARIRRDDARKLIAAGTDPSEARKAGKVAQTAKAEAQVLADAGLPGVGTFEHAAREWHARMMVSKRRAASHAVKVLALLVNDLFPYIGARPMVI